MKPNPIPARGVFVSERPDLYLKPRMHAYRQNGDERAIAQAGCAACGFVRAAHTYANERGGVVHVDTGALYTGL